MIDEKKVTLAVKLMYLSPVRGTDGFEKKDFMKLSGIPDDFVETAPYRNAFDEKYTSLCLSEAPPPRQQDKTKRLDHFDIILKLIPELKLKLLMELTGYLAHEIFKEPSNDRPSRGGTSEYMNCYNHRKAHLKKIKESGSEKENIDPNSVPPIFSLEANVENSPVSAITQDTPFKSLSRVGQCLLDGQLKNPSKESSKQSVSVCTNDNTKVKLPSIEEIIEKGSMKRTVQNLFGGKLSRKTSSQSQEDRCNVQRVRDLKSSAVKVGSQLYQCVVDCKDELTQHSSASKCADAICELFGFSDIVTGDQLVRAVQSGRTGMSPLRSGNSALVNIVRVSVCVYFFFIMKIF